MSETKTKISRAKNSHLALDVTILKFNNCSVANCSAFGALVNFTFSHERNTERIDRKFKRQNPNLDAASRKGSASPSDEAGCESPVNEQLWYFRFLEMGGVGVDVSGTSSLLSSPTSVSAGGWSADSLLLIDEFSETPESAVS